MRSWLRISRTATVVAVLGVLMGAYSTIQWMEDETPKSIVSSEHLLIDFAADAQKEQGPWEPGYTFDRTSVGVPLDLAPRWEVIVTYSRHGAPAEDVRWHATMEILQHASGGRAWWTHEEKLHVDVHEGKAKLTLNMSNIVNQAQRMATEADVPGRLQIRVAVHHTSVVETQNGPTEAMRTARLMIDPQDSILRVDAHDDHAVFEVAGEKGFPKTAAAIGVFTLAVGSVVLYCRTRVPVSAIDSALPVRNLRVPDQAVHIDPQSLAHLARLRGSTLLIDQETGLLYLEGDVPMVGRLEMEEPSASKREPQRSGKKQTDTCDDYEVTGREGR